MASRGGPGKTLGGPGGPKGSQRLLGESWPPSWGLLGESRDVLGGLEGSWEGREVWVLESSWRGSWGCPGGDGPGEDPWEKPRGILQGGPGVNPGGCWGFPEGSSKATGNPARVLGRCWRMFGPGGQVASRRCARVLSGPARSWIKFVGTFGDGALNYVRVCQNQKIIILRVPEGSGGVLGPLGGVLGPWGELRKTSPPTHTPTSELPKCVYTYLGLKTRYV